MLSQKWCESNNIHTTCVSDPETLLLAQVNRLQPLTIENNLVNCFWSQSQQIGDTNDSSLPVFFCFVHAATQTILEASNLFRLTSLGAMKQHFHYDSLTQNEQRWQSKSANQTPSLWHPTSASACPGTSHCEFNHVQCFVFWPATAHLLLFCQFIFHFRLSANFIRA